jgi:uncharacterized protein
MKLKRFFPLLLLLCAFSSAWAESSPGKYHAFRLHPGQDLKSELTRFIQEKELGACAVVTCVGSLTRANLRFANEPSGSVVEGPLEIISLVGCGGKGSWHLHLSVSDKEGRMTGGHLMHGSTVRTTAEIVLVELTELEFERADDPETGYKELRVDRK